MYQHMGVMQQIDAVNSKVMKKLQVVCKSCKTDGRETDRNIIQQERTFRNYVNTS